MKTTADNLHRMIQKFRYDLWDRGLSIPYCKTEKNSEEDVIQAATDFLTALTNGNVDIDNLTSSQQKFIRKNL
jgi:hypothetical protein